MNYRLVAGKLFERIGPAHTHLPVLLVDIALHEGQTKIPLTDGQTTILFCFEGQLTIAGQAIIDGDLASPYW